MKFTDTVEREDGKPVKITCERPTYTEYVALVTANEMRVRELLAITTMHQAAGVREITDLDAHLKGEKDFLARRDAINEAINRSGAEFVANHLVDWDFEDDGQKLPPSLETVYERWDLVGTPILAALMQRFRGRPGEAKNLSRHSSGSGGIETSPKAAGSADNDSQLPTAAG